MSRPLSVTPRRQRIYDFIVKHKIDHDGVSPTVKEIGTACDISSTGVVRYYLVSLERLGLIEYGKCRKSRMIKVIGGSWIAPAGYRADRAVKSVSSVTE
jgi:predicted MarR family transcription regulator